MVYLLKWDNNLVFILAEEEVPLILNCINSSADNFKLYSTTQQYGLPVCYNLGSEQPESYYLKLISNSQLVGHRNCVYSEVHQAPTFISSETETLNLNYSDYNTYVQSDLSCSLGSNVVALEVTPDNEVTSAGDLDRFEVKTLSELTSIKNLTLTSPPSWIISQATLGSSKALEVTPDNEVTSAGDLDRFEVKTLNLFDLKQLQSPEGFRFPIPSNLREFARLFELDQSNMSKLINGKRKSHKGWRLV